MKQYIKRLMLTVCMAVCLVSLSACSAKTDAAQADSLDPQMAGYITQVTENLLQAITSLDAASAEEMEANLVKQKENGIASGVTSWISVMHDTGAFVDVISSEATAAEDGTYVGTVMAQFENRTAEFKIFYAMDDTQQSLEPTSIAISPAYSTGEKMTKAAMNTLMGMGTVFLVLIFISLLIGGFKYIRKFEDSMKAREAAKAPAVPAPPVTETAAPAVEEDLTDDLELVAVITAAVAASAGSSADGLVVRSIKRAPGAKWKRA